MNIKEIKELMEAVAQNGIAELEVERAGVKVRIRKEGTPVVTSSVSVPISQSVAPFHGASLSVGPGEVSAPFKVPSETLAQNDEDLFIVRSPIVGTFYRSPNPTAEPFVVVGDSIEPGRVLCIIEAMKLMNEIEAEVSGEIVKIYVENGEPVEFGQSLFGIRPSKKG
ncbi:MAG: acetyl-CoA carboxylase biotin carboxyl carrier protein [Acidobacteriota bacterium]